MLYRTETAKAEREGRVSTIPTPAAGGAEVVYRIGVVRHGDAVDAFLSYLRIGAGAKAVLEKAGLAPAQPSA
jgi:hypothetical protein